MEFTLVYKMVFYFQGHYKLIIETYYDITIGDTADYILGTFRRDFLRAQTFKTLITSLFEDMWVQNRN